MKIFLIKPYGFCPGVRNTINKTLSIIKNNKNAHIYLIGQIIHNNVINQEILKNKNVKILDDSNTSRLDLVKSIKTKNNIIIFSAHGSDPKAIKLAWKKAKVYDLACSYVAKISKTIKEFISLGYFIAYYGSKNHPEAKAAKAIGGKKLIIFKQKSDLKNILHKDKICVVSQSTMDFFAYQNTKAFFRKTKKLIFLNTICVSSKVRQSNALFTKKFDLVFVLSDKKSHNGKSLCEVLKTNQKKVILIDPDNYILDKKLFVDIHTCAIFTSTSVHGEQVENFIKALKKLK